MLYTESVNKDTIYSVPKQNLVVLRQTSEIYLVFMRYLPHLILEEAKVYKCSRFGKICSTLQIQGWDFLACPLDSIWKAFPFHLPAQGQVEIMPLSGFSYSPKMKRDMRDMKERYGSLSVWIK